MERIQTIVLYNNNSIIYIIYVHVTVQNEKEIIRWVIRNNNILINIMMSSVLSLFATDPTHFIAGSNFDTISLWHAYYTEI